MALVEYMRDLDNDVRYRTRFETDGGTVIEFVVQLEFMASERWCPVVRYDTAHGFAHRDRYYPDGEVSKHEPLPTTAYNAALTLALRDVRTNWEDWVRPFRRSSP